MKRVIILFLFSFFISCNSIYQSAQTPDDIYFSPGSDNSTSKKYQTDEYQNYISSTDDAYLRMRVYNRVRWSQIDDFNYWNDIRFNFFPYTYSSWMMNPFFQNNWFWGWSNPFSNNLYWGWGNPYFSNNWFYHFGNPYFGNNFFFSPWNSQGSFTWNQRTQTRYFYNQSFSNLNAARNRNYNNSNTYTSPGRYNNLNRTVITPNSSWSRPSRSFDNSSSSSSNRAPSMSSGGFSGGFKSAGSSAGTSRGGRN